MASSLNRAVTHRFASSGSSNIFLPLARPKITLVLKGQLSTCHFNSLAPLPLSHYRGLSTVTSLHQGQFSPSTLLDGSSRSKSRPYSADHRRFKASTVTMAETEVDTSLPTASWGPESIELYKRLSSDLIEHGNGDWVEHISAVFNGERRLFTKAAISELPGKFFEYQFFYNTKEQRLKGIIQFGFYTQGPAGYVHGGASSTMMDSAIGVCVNNCFSQCVTVTLTTNYKSLLPLGTTALVEAWVDKVEGRKIFGLAEMKSPDGKVTYVTASALFIQFEPKDSCL